MGYDSFILIQGKNIKGEILDLYYSCFSGSHGCGCHHYLYTKRYDSPLVSYSGTKDMGTYCHLINFSCIEEDYKNNFGGISNIDTDVANILKSGTDREKLNLLKEYIDNLQESNKNESWLDELESYYQLCNDYINQGYSDLLIYYGIEP